MHSSTKIIEGTLDGQMVYESNVRFINYGRLWRFYSHEYILAIWNFAPETLRDYGKVRIPVTTGQ